MAKKRLSKAEGDKLMPFIQEFNAVAKVFLKLMNQRIDNREKRIKVYLTDISLPASNYNISIQTVDIYQTIVKKKGQLSTNQGMGWEKGLNRNKGYII